jgi:hypothetical protein
MSVVDALIVALPSLAAFVLAALSRETVGGIGEQS